jgi:hypothetical protein
MRDDKGAMFNPCRGRYAYDNEDTRKAHRQANSAVGPLKMAKNGELTRKNRQVL